MSVELPPFHPPVNGADRCPVASVSKDPEAAYASDLERLKALRAVPEEEGKQTFYLGTRMSKLAMVQTNLVKAALEKEWPDVDVRIYGMTTSGDNNQSQPLYLMGGKALWTKELEVALIEGQVDAIVHSLKDVPTEFPPGCELGAVLEREDPSDALVVKEGLSYTSLEEMPDGSVIGTSSVRRVAQLRRRFPKLKFADVRGLVQTRLRKLDDPTSSYTALILASAGLIRLGLGHRITAAVTSPVLYHAVGQGAIGVEMRIGDERAKEIVGSLECWRTGWQCRAERSMLKVLEGGCSVPVGVESSLVELALPGSPPPQATFLSGAPRPHNRAEDPHAATITLHGTVTSLSGTSSVIASITRNVYSIADAEALGADIAAELIAGGGREILEELEGMSRRCMERMGPRCPSRVMGGRRLISRLLLRGRGGAAWASS
ncbi:porphobilinogen deaminase, dipyromethane cofactor binding domain-domain-containing protein [Leucosporidium creatinivorum]|uniref:Porphobilinogen deaminase n=1 Tax=Leucosporidium creatinivorum TaxID=106004 RepID=A0A1Y2D5W6_9BASI|nr:porphobilinogen deaminase, dipyromethane cofactor binding domain-domain-containing protein [Leucosporidium creatinivorum]